MLFSWLAFYLQVKNDCVTESFHIDVKFLAHKTSSTNADALIERPQNVRKVGGHIFVCWGCRFCLISTIFYYSILELFPQ